MISLEKWMILASLQNCLTIRVIWVKQSLPLALNGRPKLIKSPNLVTLSRNIRSWNFSPPLIQFIDQLYCYSLTTVNWNVDVIVCHLTIKMLGGEPWSSGYGRRLKFQRSWVWIPAPYTGWTWHFSHWFVVKNCIICLKRTENKRKRGQGWPIFLKLNCLRYCFSSKSIPSFAWRLRQQ